MKRKKIMFIEEDGDQSYSSTDWYFDNDGFYGKDAGSKNANGLIIFGNNNYRGMFYCEERTERIVRNYFEKDYPTDAYELAKKLSLKLGKRYVCREISGCCQGDWNYAFYPEEEFSEEMINEIEAVYFGTATFFRGIDQDGDCLEEIVIDSFYDDSQIKNKIKQLGYKLKDVIIKKISGTSTINIYKTI